MAVSLYTGGFVVPLNVELDGWTPTSTLIRALSDHVDCALDEPAHSKTTKSPTTATVAH